MHPPETRQAALELIGAGHTDRDVSRRLCIPRRTIADWRRPSNPTRRQALCPRCWRTTRTIRLSDADYSELLGLYLGDGCIAEHPRTFRLRIALDAAYPLIIRDARLLLQRVFPENPVGLVAAHGGTMLFVSVYSSHLPCLLPQHGLGPKHQRPIVLEAWQQAALDAEPWSFIRACIRTDGCSFINRTGPYEYLSYDFSNRSTEIVDLFCRALERCGLEFRRTRWERADIWRVRINKRASVRLMESHVGAKE